MRRFEPLMFLLPESAKLQASLHYDPISNLDNLMKFIKAYIIHTYIKCDY